MAAILTVPGLLLAGCGGDTTAPPTARSSAATGATPSTLPVPTLTRRPAPSPSASTSPTSRPSPSARATASLGAAPDTVSKVLVVVVENHSLDQMRSGMPWTYGLAQTYGYADHYDAITHPSLPNYLAMTGGSTYGVTNDEGPGTNGTTAPSVFGDALAHGRTATTYAEAMPEPCATANSGRYAVRHNPWAYHLSERTLCNRHDTGLAALSGDVAAGTLPDVGFVVPDVCNDAHDCSLTTADAWMRRVVGDVLRGPDFVSGRLAVVITADEDDRSSGNRVLTVVAQRSLHGLVVSTPLTHYSLARSLFEVAGAAPRLQAQGATDLLATFGLKARG